jgi:hypothetical protein
LISRVTVPYTGMLGAAGDYVACRRLCTSIQVLSEVLLCGGSHLNDHVVGY